MTPPCREAGRFAPVLLASLVVHLAALYGVWQHEGTRREQAPDTVVAYLELGRPGDAPVAAPEGRALPAAPPPSSVPAPAAVPNKGALPAAALPSNPAPAPARFPAPGGKGAAPAPNVASLPAPAAAASPGGGHLSGGPSRASKGGGSGEGAGANLASAPAGTAAPAAAARGGGGHESRGSYLGRLKWLIEAHKRYPLAARNAGREGSCLRRFLLRRDGSLQQVETVTSCGHPFLDAAATKAISSVGAFPPVPAELSPDEPFEVTITFALAGTRTVSHP